MVESSCSELAEDMLEHYYSVTKKLKISSFKKKIVRKVGKEKWRIIRPSHIEAQVKIYSQPVNDRHLSKQKKISA